MWTNGGLKAGFKVTKVLNNQFEDILVPVIISELHILKIQRKSLWRNTVMFHQAFFGKGPEAFQAVDVNPAAGESSFVIDLQVSVATEHQRIVTAESVGVDDAAPAHHLDGQSQKGFSPYVRHHLDADQTVTLQDAEDRDLSGSTPTAVALALATEVAFVKLNFTAQQLIAVPGLGQYRHSYGSYGFIGGIVRDPHLPGDLPGG